MSIEIQNQWAAIIIPGAPWDSGERGSIAQCGVWRFLLWVDSSGGNRRAVPWFVPFRQ